MPILFMFHFYIFKVIAKVKSFKYMCVFVRYLGA